MVAIDRHETDGALISVGDTDFKAPGSAPTSYRSLAIDGVRRNYRSAIAPTSKVPTLVTRVAKFATMMN